MQHVLSAVAVLAFLASVASAQGIAEATEPNNSASTATVLPTGLQGYGAIDTSGTDEDWFKISLAVDCDYSIWTGPGFTNQIGDTRVRILAADGSTVLTDVDDGNTATHGFYTTFQGALAAGDYFVCVRGYSPTYAGTYTLDVIEASPGTYVPITPPLTPVAESAEDNDPRNVGGTATISGLFSLNSGNTAVGAGGTTYTSATGDYDFYEIVVAAPVTLTTETVVGAASPANLDTVIHLVDSTLARIAYDDEGGVGSLSKLTYSITAPGTYYVVVSGWGTYSGNYVLTILGDLPPLPVGQASVVAHVGGCTGSAGTPTLSTRAAAYSSAPHPEMPVLGSEFWVDVTNLPADAAFIRMIGLQARSTYFNLGWLGFPACDIELYPVGLLFTVSEPSGYSFWSTPTPAKLGLIGLPLEMQVVVLEATPALALTISNRMTAVCGISH